MKGSLRRRDAGIVDDMNDVGDWLESIGLGRYAELFSKNDIETGHLPDLTHELLEAIGVESVGHRMTLLKAASSLSVDVQAAREDPPTATTPIPRGPAEHRQLTVMFCDLVGSVELGEQMDVEKYREVLGAFRDAVVEAVQRYEGFIARHQGDGVLSYFGFPMAHEDDPERAVRAGLAAVHAVGALPRQGTRRLEVRVGIATGLAVVGDVLSTGASQESELAAFGPTPNLAARLQGLADPSSVLISETTAQLVSGLFVTKAIDRVRLKGMSSAVSAHTVLRESSVVSRFDAREEKQLSPFVGREGELSLVLERWKQVTAGHGQLVLISAEPGVGKSRLLREVARTIGAEHFEAVRLQCSPYHQNSALYPVVQGIRRALQLEKATEPREALHNLTERIGFDDGSSVPLLTSLLGLSSEGQHPSLDFPAEERRRQTLELLVRWLFAQADRRPVILFGEDLHWIDPTTQELLQQVIDKLPDYRVLCLFTFRPEYSAPWRPEGNVTSFSLNHLARTDSRELIKGLIGQSNLGAETVEAIISRTDGVPLYLEEVSRTLIEQAGEFPGFVPESLRDALTARLDRLGEAKLVAQTAAVLGRQFDVDVLRDVFEGPAEALDDGLDTLADAGLVHRRAGSSDYQFKHALVRDTAYDSLLRPNQASLHRRVAEALAMRDLEQLDDMLVSVATHYEAAGMSAEAAEFLVRAAAKAAEDYAHHEAIELLRRALPQAETATELLNDRCTPAHILLNTAQSLYFIGDYKGSTELLQAESTKLHGDDEGSIAADWYFWLAHGFARTAGTREAIEPAERSIALSVRKGDDLTAGKAHGVLVLNAAHGADPLFGEQHGRASVEFLERAGDQYWLGMTHFYLSMLFGPTSRFQEALVHARRTEQLGTEIGDDRLRAYSLFGEGLIYAFYGDGHRAVNLCERAVAIAPDPSSRGNASGCAAFAQFATGDYAGALPILRNALGFWAQYPYGDCMLRSAIGESLYELNELDEAIAMASSAKQIATTCGFPYFEGCLKRLDGWFAFRAQRTDEAKRDMGQALEIFQRFGAKREVAKTLRALAKLHRNFGEDDLAFEQERSAQSLTWDHID
jgi:class 3 adenylate cyclase/tetratricopeptide (TPR) repeat protein